MANVVLSPFLKPRPPMIHSMNDMKAIPPT